MDESLITPDQPTDSDTVEPGVEAPKPEPKTKTKSKKTRSLNLQGMMVPMLIGFLFIAGYLVSQITSVKNLVNDVDARLTKLEKPNNYVAEQVATDKFQAVFLSSGQVYFGKITHVDINTLTLEHVYTTAPGSFNADGTAKGDISLTKVTSGVHQPEDKLNVERRNIDFWENLKNDGKIAQAISASEKAKKK